MAAKDKLGNGIYLYCMVDAAKKMCLYEDLCKEALEKNKAFKLWYEKQSFDAVRQMKEDQKQMVKAKPFFKVFTILFFILMLIYRSIVVTNIIKKQKDVARPAVSNETIWEFLVEEDINYMKLREFDS